MRLSTFLTQASGLGSLLAIVTASAPILLAQEAGPGGSQVQAVDAQFAALQAELNGLQSRLAEVENQRTNFSYSNGCGRSVGGWYGGFELVVVRPHFQRSANLGNLIWVPGGGGGGGGGDGSDAGDAGGGGGGGGGGSDGSDAGDAGDAGGGSDGSDGADSDGADGGDADGSDGSDAADSGGSFMSAGSSLQPSYNFQATPRFFLGWRNDEGFGFRTRYWNLNGAATPYVDRTQGKNQTISQSLNLQYLDVELTQLSCLGGFEMEFGGGLRYAHSHTNTLLEPSGGSIRFASNFDGVGPTMALNIYRPMWSDNWAFFGTARGSLLFGPSSYEQSYYSGGALLQTGDNETPLDLTAIVEAQVGLERSWWFERGRFSIRSAFEAQYWTGAGSSPVNNANGSNSVLFATDQNLGAVGATISAIWEH
jgi:hypothetical protein